MNIDFARRQMIDQQVRAWTVLDPAVLDVLSSVPREDFVPAPYESMAFADTEVPLGHGEFMMTPTVEGRVLQALELDINGHVLEIGTGSGWITACLSRLAKRVVSVELFEDFSAAVARSLKEKEIENVELETGDVMRGWQPEQAHDVLVVTGSVEAIPEQFRGWVNPGGRMFIVQGQAPAMEATLCTRLNVSDWREESLFETDLPRLIHAEALPEFEF